MAATVVSQGLLAAVGWDEEYAVTGLPNLSFNGSFRFTPTQYASGAGAGQVDRLYVAQLSIAASGNFTITLTNFTDPAQFTVTMARLKFAWVQLLSGGASGITIGNATHPINLFSSATATKTIYTGGLYHDAFSPLDATGIPLTSGSSDSLKIVNNDSSNAATVNVCLMGCSA